MLKLRNYQVECINTLFQYIRNNPNKNPLLVLATGSGKSLIIAKICELIHKKKPNLNVLVLAHRKELLEQNHAELKKIYPDAPAGLFCAGLGKSEINIITIAMINSIYNKVDLLQKIDVVIVDECHFISNDSESMYQNLISDIREENPSVSLIGLTATPFRMSGGNIYGEDKLFHDIAYSADLMDLIRQGYLCPLRNKIVKKESINLAGVSKSNGDYNSKELEEAFFAENLIERTAEKIKEIARKENRKSVLVFASGKYHCYAMADELGEGAVAITDESTHQERKQAVIDFKAGKIQYLISCNIYTTGFNAPNVDMIAVLVATLSTAKYVQILGRGMRTYPNKLDCLIVDFAHNLLEHGSLNNLRVYSQKERKPEKFKICPMCEELIKVSQKECICGFVFETEHREFEPKHKKEFFQAVDIMTGESEPELYEIKKYKLDTHDKIGKPQSLKLILTLSSGDSSFKIIDYICLNHGGYAQEKAYELLDKFFPNEEKTIENIMANHKKMRIPIAVIVKMEGQWWRVMDYRF